MSRRHPLERTLGVVLTGGLLSVLVLLPTALVAQPKPLPGGGGEEGKSKCQQCDDEFAEKSAKCMGAYDRCQAPCPACKTISNCEARKPCMAPCNVKFDKCKDDAFKERKECEKGCK